jgi:glutathione reductase (NADPH)
MATKSFDVVILGGGNAGMGVTVATREAGLAVAMVEPDLLGGTCPNRGCMPKKVLVAAAHALDEIRRAPAHGITIGNPALDWAALIDREQAMIAPIPGSLGGLMQRRGVEVIRGHGRFVGRNAVAVGDDTLEAKHIVIATGAAPRPLPFPGAELSITSDVILSERRLPASVVFVGGGVVALEFAHVYARAGAEVTILEALPRLLDAMDEDAVAQLRAATERIGVAVHTGVTIERVQKNAGRLLVVYRQDRSERAIEAERVVNAAGRVAALDGLDLAAGAVETAEGRLALDPYLRSASNPAVWACGDAVTETPQLSPIAAYEGRIVGRNIVEGPRHAPDYASIPSCVFTVPALANVGLTQAAAEAKGIALKIATNDLHEWLSGRTFAEDAAWAKVLIDRDRDRIAGAHILGHAGEELIHVFAVAMRHNITASEVGDMIYGFPTFSADIRSML